MDTGVVPIWVIYDNATDMPGQFVARKWLLDQPTDAVLLGKTLDDVRAQLPSGLMCLSRSDADDPKIVEMWL